MRKIDHPLLVLGPESEHILLLRSVERVQLPNRNLPQFGHRVFWVFQQDKTGNRVVTGWPSNVRWVNDDEPQLALGPDQITILMAVTVDNGNNWIIEAQSVGQGGQSGGGTAASITVDDSQFDNLTGDNVQSVLESVDTALDSVGGTAGAVSIDTSDFEVVTGTNLLEAMQSVDTSLLNVGSTGIRSGGQATNLGSGVIRIASGSGAILDTSNPGTPDEHQVNWAQTDINLSGINGVSYVYVDLTGVQSTTSIPQPDDYRNRIYLHRVNVIGGQISAVSSIVVPVQQYGPNNWDVWRALGPVKNGFVISANGSNLSINISEGEIFQAGAGFYLDSLSPNRVQYTAKIPATFRHITRAGVQSADTTTLDVTQWDNNGTVEPISGAAGRATIFTLKMFNANGGNIRIARGQTVYNSVSAALSALQAGNYQPVLPVSYNEAITIGWIIAQKGATALNDGTQVFITANKFGLIGGALVSAGAAWLPVGEVNELQLNNNGTLGPANVFRNGSALDIRQGTTPQQLRVFGTTDITGLNYEAADIRVIQGTGNKYVKLGVDRAGTGSSTIGLWLAGSTTGAITWHLPDGTATGGNARGSGSIDLQISRNASTQVVSGTNGFMVSSLRSAVGGTYSSAISCFGGNMTSNYCFAAASREHQLQGERAASIASFGAVIGAGGSVSLGSTNATINSSAGSSVVIATDAATINGSTSATIATRAAYLDGIYNVQMGYSFVSNNSKNHVITIGNSSVIPIGYVQIDPELVAYYLSNGSNSRLVPSVANTVSNRQSSIPLPISAWAIYDVDLLISLINGNDSTYVKSRLQNSFTLDRPTGATVFSPTVSVPTGTPPITVDLAVIMLSGLPYMYLRTSVNPGVFPPPGDPDEGAYFISVRGEIRFKTEDATFI